MLNRMTGEARAALHAASEEARCRRHQVGTPHLLLGLLADPSGRPAETLARMGFSVVDVQLTIRRRLGLPQGRILGRRSRPVLSSRLERTLAAAAHEAQRSGQPSIDAEHLLVALLAQPDSKAARLLNRLRENGQRTIAS